MYHVANDRPWSYNGHLDYQVVETCRFETRQHRHLRPAFDLEHTDRIALLTHSIYRRIVLGNIGECILYLVMLQGQVEALAYTRQHSQGKYIDLEKTQRFYVVF